MRLTQEHLARAAGVTPQQMQKYELGANRVSASKLFVIACALDADINSLFDGLHSAAEQPCSGPESQVFTTAEAGPIDRLLVTMTPQRRRLVLALARAGGRR